MISNAAIGTIHTAVYFSLLPLHDQGAINAERARGWGNLRFPWIHKIDPFAFHSVNTLPWKTHAAIPPCRAL